MDNVVVVNVADFQNPNDPEGRSYRQTNAELKHNIPVGALVEIVHDDEEDEVKYGTGCRLFVVWHGRDCDQTPLYWLSTEKNDTEKHYESFSNSTWLGGYSEYSLEVVKTS